MKKTKYRELLRRDIQKSRLRRFHVPQEPFQQRWVEARKWWEDDYAHMLTIQPMYRLVIADDGSVTTQHYDMLEAFLPKLDAAYACANDLPDWCKRKLAVLMMLDCNDLDRDDLPGIGQRLENNVFWIFPDEEEK